MERNYWEKMAPTYGDKIFDVLANDRKALIRAVIMQYAGKNKSVIDIGCAIGKWLPVLAPAFKKVVAVDISAKNLDIAKCRSMSVISSEAVLLMVSRLARSSFSSLPFDHVAI